MSELVGEWDAADEEKLASIKAGLYRALSKHPAAEMLKDMEWLILKLGARVGRERGADGGSTQDASMSPSAGHPADKTPTSGD